MTVHDNLGVMSLKGHFFCIRPLFYLCFGVFFLAAVELQADIRGISLTTDATTALEGAVNGDTVELLYTLLNSERKELESERFTAKLGGGTMSGRTNVGISIPDTATYICFKFVDEILHSLLVIVEPCEDFSAPNLEKGGQFRASRGLDLRANIFSISSAKLSRELRDFTSTEEVLLQREREFFDLIERNPFNATHYRPIGWLVRDLLERSAPIGRLVRQDYFGIHQESYSDASDLIRGVVLGDRFTSGGTNVAKEVLLAMQKIDLNQYSFGRVNFLNEYWSSLQFLYETRATIMRENGDDGTQAAKEFAEYCFMHADSTEYSACLFNFSGSSGLLIEADPSYSTVPSSDLMITMQTLVKATKCMPEQAGYSSELFDRHLATICGKDEGRCKRYFSDMRNCYDQRNSTNE